MATKKTKSTKSKEVKTPVVESTSTIREVKKETSMETGKNILVFKTVSDGAWHFGHFIKNLVKPINPTTLKRQWSLWFVLFVEAIGTFALVSWIIMPNVFAFGMTADTNFYDYLGPTGQAFGNLMDEWFSMPLWTAFYVGVGIMLLVAMFIWVSANFNPVVTITEVSFGYDSMLKGTTKIGAQFGGAFAAAFFYANVAMWIGTADATSLDAVSPVINYTFFNLGGESIQMYDPNEAWYWGISILMEAFWVFILLGLVFWGKVSKAKRIFVVGLGIIPVVFAASFTGTVSLNPARMIAPAVVHDVMLSTGASDTYMQWIWIYLLGQLAGAFIFSMMYRKQHVGNSIKKVEKEFGALEVKTSKNIATENAGQKEKIIFVEAEIRSLLNSMTDTELRSMAKRYGVTTTKNMTKKQLVDSLVKVRTIDFASKLLGKDFVKNYYKSTGLQ